MHMKKKGKELILCIVLAVSLVGCATGANNTADTSEAMEAATSDVQQTSEEIATQEITTPETTMPETTVSETATPETTIPETTIPAAVITEAEDDGEKKNIPRQTVGTAADDRADAFFEGSVFIGDSVMMGFRNFCLKQPEGFLGTPQFLVSGSYSLRNALKEVSADSIHPLYQGEQRLIWDSIALMKATKAFLFFGLNDIGMEGLDLSCEYYLQIITNIQEASPDTEIFVLSTTNLLAGSELKVLNNENIRIFNDRMKEACETYGVSYIEIADYLAGEDGSLLPEYCSDGFLHQTNAAYQIWTDVLRSYAVSVNPDLYGPIMEPETESTSEPSVR